MIATENCQQKKKKKNASDFNQKLVNLLNNIDQILSSSVWLLS